MLAKFPYTAASVNVQLQTTQNWSEQNTYPFPKTHNLYNL